MNISHIHRELYKFEYSYLSGKKNNVNFSI